MSTQTKARASRRATLLGDRPGSYAIARHVRMSPTKVRRVVDVVRGLDVGEALDVLRFAPQAASEPVFKVVASAVANAIDTEGLDSGELYISAAFVDEGMTLRRIRPRAKGAASRIDKRGSHITVVVEPRVAPQERHSKIADDEEKLKTAVENAEQRAAAKDAELQTAVKEADAADAASKAAKQDATAEAESPAGDDATTEPSATSDEQKEV